MIKILFDKNTEKERFLEVSHILERPIKNSFSGSISLTIEKSEDFPSYDEFINNPDFNTLEIIDDGLIVPLQGRYNYIEDFTTDYFSDTKTFLVGIFLGYKLEQNADV